MNTARLLPFLWRALPGKLHRPLRAGDDFFWLGPIRDLLSFAVFRELFPLPCGTARLVLLSGGRQARACSYERG